MMAAPDGYKPLNLRGWLATKWISAELMMLHVEKTNNIM